MIVRRNLSRKGSDTEYTMALTAVEFAAMKACIAACADSLASGIPSMYLGLVTHIEAHMMFPTETN